MLNTMIIGNKITEARKKRNLSQTQLADILAISPQAVSKWERGESMPDIITFNRMAEVLNVDLNYFSESFESNISDVPKVNKEDSRGWDMSSGDWNNADFSGLKGLGKRFNSSNIVNCLFLKSDLSKIELKGNNITGCDFTGSTFCGSKFLSMNVQKNKFNNCNMKDSIYNNCHIAESDFKGANLNGSVLKKSALIKNDISEMMFIDIQFDRVVITGVIFDTSISGCSFVGCQFKNVEFKDVTFKNTFFKNCDIKKVKFTNCKADRLTYSFLQNGKADVSNIMVIED